MYNASQTHGLLSIVIQSFQLLPGGIVCGVIVTLFEFNHC